MFYEEIIKGALKRDKQGTNDGRIYPLPIPLVVTHKPPEPSFTHWTELRKPIVIA